MALIHRAELHPSKLELLTDWLPARRWYPAADASGLRRVAAYRFDDPAGQVGIETLVVQAADGPLTQVPLTYRAAPLDGHDRWLIGTLEHSVLGPRWVYDACGDGVYASALAHTILTGTGEAEEFVDVDGRLERREVAMSVRGSGAPGADVPTIDAITRVEDDDPTLIVTDSIELSVVRILGGTSAEVPLTLVGTWNDRPTPLLLAQARAL